MLRFVHSDVVYCHRGTLVNRDITSRKATLSPFVSLFDHLKELESKLQVLMSDTRSNWFPYVDKTNQWLSDEKN